MTVAALPSVAEYLEDGVTTSFPAPFRFKAPTDLVVERIIAGDVVPLALGIDYTVTGGMTDAGGTVERLVASTGATLRIRRQTARAQPMVYTTGDRFPAVSHEEALDRQMLIAQEQAADHADLDSRALTVPAGEIAPPLPPLADRIGGAKKVLAVDQDSGSFVVEPIGETFQGNTGPANSTYSTIAKLAAAAITNQSAILAPSEGSGLTGATYTWKTGNYTGRNDVIASTWLDPATGAVTPISQGAWVLPDSNAVTFRQQGTGATIRRNQDKAREQVSVLDFGAKGDGVTDDTAAFNAAIDTKKAVVVPYTAAGYSVANIKVLDGMYVDAEKTGDSVSTPKLLVRTNGAAAFYNAAMANVFNVTIANLACEAAPGVLDARFYDQATMTFYSAYFTFRHIETYLSLSISYKGLFIFAVWDHPRDGYYGSPTNTKHVFIDARAGSYGQTNRQNINRIKGGKIFSAFGDQGAIICSYATKWVISDVTDFEALHTAAFRGYNTTQVKFDNTWFEGIDADALVALSDLGGAGCSAIFSECAFVLTNPKPRYAVTIGGGELSFIDSIFNLVPAGMRLTNNGARVVKNDNCFPDGAGAANFMDGAFADISLGGRRRLNGAPDNGIAGMTIQNAGGSASTGGFMSRKDIAVGTSFVTVATSATGLGGSCVISGFDPSGGGQFRVTKDWQGSTIRDVVVLLNNTGKVLTFQAVGNDLQMKCDVGMLNVFTTLNH